MLQPGCCRKFDWMIEMNILNNDRASVDLMNDGSLIDAFTTSARAGNPLRVNLTRVLANQAVSNWSQWASVAGCVPVPFLGAAAIGAVQLKMISELCLIYGVPFHNKIVRSTLLSLTASTMTEYTSRGISSVVARCVPLLGSSLAILVQPLMAYTSTYALGAVFINHFESDANINAATITKLTPLYAAEFGHVKNLFKDRRQPVL
jgi:uncharacterized protein (DUF697 family)